MLTTEDIIKLFEGDDRCHICGCTIRQEESLCWMRGVQTFSRSDGKKNLVKKFIFHEECYDDSWEQA